MYDHLCTQKRNWKVLYLVTLKKINDAVYQ